MNLGVPSPRGEVWRKVGYAALVMAAVGTFYWTVIPIGGTTLLEYELSHFGFAAIIFGRLAYVIGKAWYQSTGARRTKSIEGPRTYSVPRRFGLATLFVITLAFGILSAVMQWVHLPPIAVGIVLAFVALVGVLQVVFDQTPRHASMIAGSLWFSISVMGYWFVADPTYLTFSPSTIAFHAACWALGGALIGYCAGTLVGGVFLIADSVAGFLWGRPNLAAARVSEPPADATPSAEHSLSESTRDPNYPSYARANSPQRSSNL